MMLVPSKAIALALFATVASGLATTANSLPAASPLALESAVAPSFEAVRYRGRGFVGAGIGLAAGAIIGGAILNATQPRGYYGYNNGYYGGGYGYGYEPVYGGYQPGYVEAPGYGYAPGPAYRQGYVGGGNDVAYCQQRYRSYDPSSGTYLGFDGLRHPC